MIAPNDAVAKARQLSLRLVDVACDLRDILPALNDAGDVEAVQDALWHVEQAITAIGDVGRYESGNDP